MTEADLNWLAGWLEGEGCFSFMRRTSKLTGYEERKFVISASSIDRDVISRVAALLDINITGPERRKLPHHKPCYTCRLGKREDVLEWCRKLRPLMGGRRQGQIDLLLAADKQFPPRRMGRPRERTT